MSFADASDRTPGFKFIGRTKDDLWGKWVIDDSHHFTSEQRDQWRQERDTKRQLRQQQEQQRQAAALPASERNRHYRSMLAQLSLDSIDRADLHRRGLTNDEIAAWGVKSVEQWQRLAIELPHTLPGINLDGQSLNTQPGYLCPIVDVDGQLVAFQLRLRSGDIRYIWLTGKTRKRPNGPTPHLPNGELPLAIHRPIKGIRCRTIGMTESVGAKPFIASQRRGQVVIGAAGGQFASSPKMLRHSLERLSAELGTRSIEFYPDAGCLDNANVMRQYRATWKLLQRWGYQVRVAWWEQFNKTDSDIDELIDLSSIKLLTVGQFEAIARNRHKGFTRLLSLLRQPVKPKQPEQRQPSEPTTAHEYQEGDRIATWQQAIAQGYRFILDQSGTGTGKSFDSGSVEPQNFDARQAIYLSPQHRNPTVETLSTENGWIDLEARHAGLTSESTPSGGHRLKRSNRGEIPSIPGNCNRVGIIDALRAKHIQGADTAAIVCGTCPLKEACQNANGRNFGFLNQRRSALSSSKLRAHPDSLPSPEDYELDQTLLIWDEAGENLIVKRNVVVTMQDLEQTITALLKVALFEPLQALLTALLPYLDGSTRADRYGLNHAAVVKLLGNVEAIDPSAIERALQPDLSFLNTTAEYGVELADLPPGVRKKFADRDRDGAELAEQRVVKHWLPDLLRVLQGQVGSLHLDRQSLTTSLPNDRHRAIAAAARANVFLDATLSREDLALKLNCHPEEIFVCRQRVKDADNLTVTQVTDLGRMGMQRGADQQRRAAAIASHYQQLDPTTKAIDFKRLADESMGAWWRDSRGVNDFETTKTLILIGTPCRNLSDLQAEYAILTGCHDANDAGFQAFVDRVILADIHQAIGRLRAHRRPNEQLQVILLNDFALDIPTQQVSAVDITPDAASKQQRIILAARQAIEQIKSAGEKLTQAAVAQIVGCSQARISQLWDFINFATGDSNSKIYNSADSPPDSDLVQVVEAVATEASTEAVLRSLNEMFFDWLAPHQWQQLWQELSGKAQTGILQAVLLTLPEPQIKRIERAII
ncbi:hypothetical protein H6F67_22255 [Microcoleus sp. FACHB-1515]|nr:hypothetical protein [Microcoleus sp. FACHB-1515]